MAESIGRKPTTTTTGGALSGPDLQAASFSREGVVDRSGIFRGEASARGLEGIAGGIQGIGQLALDVDEGIAKANLERDLLDELDFAKETRQEDFPERQRERFEQASVDLKVAEQKRDLLKEDLGEGGAIEALAPEFSDITNRLERAKRSGRMSVDEFEIRTREALRRAIAKRPGLINELTAHAEATLNLRGARERLDFQDKQLAAEGQEEAARRDRVIKQLDRANLPFNFDAPTERLENQLNTFRQQEVAWDEGKRLREAKETMSQEEGLSLLEQHGRFVGAGAFNEFSQQVSSMFTPGMSGTDLTNRKAETIALLAQKRSEIDAMGRTSKTTNTQEFKDFRDNWMGAMENLAKTLQGAASGEEAANIAKNVSAVIQGEWQRRVFDTGITPELTRLATAMHPLMQGESLLARQEKVQNSVAQMWESLVLGAVNTPALSRTGQTNINGVDSDLAVMLGYGAQGYVPKDAANPGNSAPNDFEKMVNSAAEVIDRDITRNPTAAFKTMTDTIKTLSDPKVRENLNNATDATKNTLVEIAIKQASALEPDRNRFLNSAKEQGVIIRPRTLPNGSLQFFTEGDTPKDRELLKQFNSKFTKKYNDLIKFKSTLFGMSVPQAADLLSDVYSGGSVEELKSVIDTRRQALQEGASRTSAVEDSYLDKVIQVESSGRADIKADRSSATGLGQFIESTWIDTLKKHNPEIMQGKTEEEILELRKDPELSKQMLAAHTADNAQILDKAGFKTTDTNLYLAHFLGAGGARRLLAADGNTPIQQAVNRDSIKANPPVFKGINTVDDLINWARRKMNEA